MRKIIVHAMLSLDGVMQAPGGPKEDVSGGFKYGGWSAPFGDAIYSNAVQQELQQKADYLLGSTTYKIWAPYWPANGAFWPGINSCTKYVFSQKMKKNDPLITGWSHSVLVKNIAAIKKIKNTRGLPIQVWGSSQLVQLLLKHGLADELKLKIHPVILGKGKKLFDSAAMPTAFTLMASMVTTTGVIIAHYKRGGKVKTGMAGARKIKK
ncbi:MAG: dihydrofolate reductase family protein [Flavihumibacter sp.]|nr:dihydrofolate reductase family protein [Flavihumibacter sp.]